MPEILIQKAVQNRIGHGRAHGKEVRAHKDDIENCPVFRVGIRTEIRDDVDEVQRQPTDGEDHRDHAE